MQEKIICTLAKPKSQVQSGGSFDIDFDIKDPNQKVLLDGERERQGDYVLTANTVGEYAFCFENDMSTLTDKLVDFDIMVESEPRREPPAKPGQIADQTSALEESVFRLNGMLMNIKRMQNQYVFFVGLTSGRKGAQIGMLEVYVYATLDTSRTLLMGQAASAQNQQVEKYIPVVHQSLLTL